ncbi:MAG: hypothetical protein ABIP19_02795 [Dermatophilaceae bacterium]
MTDRRPGMVPPPGLQQFAGEQRRDPITALDRHGPPEGVGDQGWRVAVNTELNPDL